MGAIWVQGDPVADRIRLVAEVGGGEELEEGQEYDGNKGEGLHRRPRPLSRIDVHTVGVSWNDLSKQKNHKQGSILITSNYQGLFNEMIKFSAAFSNKYWLNCSVYK